MRKVHRRWQIVILQIMAVLYLFTLLTSSSECCQEVQILISWEEMINIFDALP